MIFSLDLELKTPCEGFGQQQAACEAAAGQRSVERLAQGVRLCRAWDFGSRCLWAWAIPPLGTFCSGHPSGINDTAPRGECFHPRGYRRGVTDPGSLLAVSGHLYRRGKKGVCAPIIRLEEPQCFL